MRRWPKNPGSAGIIKVDKDGNGRAQFKALQTSETATNFAVTQEPKVGVTIPTVKNMVLLGG